MKHLFSTAALLISALSLGQLRVASWNITYYQSGRTNAVRNVLFATFQNRSMNPDVLLMQEVMSSTGQNNLLTILNQTPGQQGQWAAAPWDPVGGDLGLAMFYRKSKVELLSTEKIDLNPRDAIVYRVRLKGYAPGSPWAPVMSLYNLHLKAGSTDEDKATRATAAITLRKHLAKQPANAHYLLGGDLNVKTADELAYRRLLFPQVTFPDQTTVSTGHLIDPILTSFSPTGTPFNWNVNELFRFVHTNDPWGTAGMNDRLDFLLMSPKLVDQKGADYVGNPSIPYSTTTWNDPNHSYRAWGNDGTTFRGPIRVVGNEMVGAVIGQALRDAVGTNPTEFDSRGNPLTQGGHIPIFCDLQVPGDLQLGASRLEFGKVPQHSIATRTMVVKNGIDTVVWGSKTKPMPLQFQVFGDFTVDLSSITLDGGSFTVPNVSMRTSTPGEKYGTLVIRDLDTGLMRSLPLRGTVAKGSRSRFGK